MGTNINFLKTTKARSVSLTANYFDAVLQYNAVAVLLVNLKDLEKFKKLLFKIEHIGTKINFLKTTKARSVLINANCFATVPQHNAVAVLPET